MKDFFQTVLSEMNKNDEMLRQQLELQRGVFRRYQEQLKTEMSRDPLNDVMAEFSRTMMASVMEVAVFQRESRKRFLEMQANLAEAYLGLLDQIEKDQTNASSGQPANGKTGDGQ